MNSLFEQTKTELEYKIEIANSRVRTKMSEMHKHIHGTSERGKINEELFPLITEKSRLKKELSLLLLKHRGGQTEAKGSEELEMESLKRNRPGRKVFKNEEQESMF